MTIGQKIKEIRRAHGLKQEDFADQLGISRSVLSQVEIDKIKPTIETLKRISAEFQVSLDYLIHGGESSQPPRFTIASDKDLTSSFYNRPSERQHLRMESRQQTEVNETPQYFSKLLPHPSGNLTEIPLLSMADQRRLVRLSLLNRSREEFEHIRLPISGKRPLMAFEVSNAEPGHGEILVCELTPLNAVREGMMVMLHTHDSFLHGWLNRINDRVLTLETADVPVKSIEEIWIVKLIIGTPFSFTNLLNQISRLTGVIEKLQSRK